MRMSSISLTTLRKIHKTMCNKIQLFLIFPNRLFRECSKAVALMTYQRLNFITQLMVVADDGVNF